MRWAGTFLECTPHARAQGALDGIPENVVPHAEIVASPIDDTRPDDTDEESTRRSPWSRARHPPGDDPCKGAQESLKRCAALGSNEQMQVSTHVGEVVDSDAETTGHGPKRLADLTLVFAKRPGTASPLAREHHMHLSPNAGR